MRAVVVLLGSLLLVACAGTPAEEGEASADAITTTDHPAERPARSRGVIAGRVKSLVAERLGVDAASVTESAKLSALGTGEVSELLAAFEQEFDVAIPDGARIVTVKDAIDWIVRHDPVSFD